MSGNRISPSRPDEAVREVTEYLRSIDLLRAYKPLVADHLGVSTATISRALAAAGTSFTDLVDAERRQRLRQILQQQEHQPRGSEVYLALGFRQVKSLYRWVRTWCPDGWSSGMPTLQYNTAPTTTNPRG